MKKGIVFIEPFLPEERNQDSRQLRQELFVFRGVCGDMPAETFLFDAVLFYDNLRSRFRTPLREGM